MAKINILDSSVFNRIAAGEVVDRPYSVVKEFVENSIDAGATSISIEIERGGKDRICVSDNGSGIEREILLPFFCQARDQQDRARGRSRRHYDAGAFRGEALASIASVANVTVKSRAAGGDCAYQISCSGGKMGEILPCARDVGTEICAENLFFNTPVRAKFLKSDKGEEAEITNSVSRFILGNPEISFRYFVDGKLCLQSFGGGLEEAVAAVYGASVLRECYEISAVKHGIAIHGYVGKPSFTKANRTYQSTFVNGRYVVNATIGSAISNAFASYLMKRQYPFYILFIDIPPEVVDVNVHPNKADVRFENNQVIYGSIYSIISSVLDGNASALEYIVGVKETPQKQEIEVVQSTMPDIKSIETPKDVPSVIAEKKIEPLQENYTWNYSYDRAPAPIWLHDSGNRENENSKEPQREEQAPDVFEENKRLILAAEQKAKQQKIIFENAVYRGCLFQTYLLYELGDDCYLIDQHAAPERLLFDRFREEMQQACPVVQPAYAVAVCSHGECAGSGFFDRPFQSFGGGRFRV